MKILKWFFRLLILTIVGFLGVGLYQSYRGGYFSVPAISDDAYLISFKNGLRGIVHNIKVSDNTYEASPKYFRRLTLANRDRIYIGVPMEVASWFEETWSTCDTKDSAEIQESLEPNMPEELRSRLQGARFEAYCFIETDDEKRIFRGVIYSVPRR